MDKSTRQRNKELRAAARAEWEAQKKADKALVLEALRAILKDPEATAEQRVFAVAVLDSMEYYGFVPYDVKHPGRDSSELVAEFARKMEVSGNE